MISSTSQPLKAKLLHAIQSTTAAHSAKRSSIAAGECAAGKFVARLALEAVFDASSAAPGEKVTGAGLTG